MNFLQLLASGASFLNFNFQNKLTSGADLNKVQNNKSGFQKVINNSQQIDNSSQLPNRIQEDQTKILAQMLQNERSQLIARYLQLNLQLLQGNAHTQKNQKNNDQGILNFFLPTMNNQQNCQKQQNSSNINQHCPSNSKKKIKKIINCPHHDRQHYAKGMCNNCYHKFGRNKKPMKCPHQKLYAAGMCQNCYINHYNKKKREEAKGLHQIQEKSQIVNQCEDQEQKIIKEHNQNQNNINEQINDQVVQKNIQN